MAMQIYGPIADPMDCDDKGSASLSRTSSGGSSTTSLSGVTLHGEQSVFLPGLPGEVASYSKPEEKDEDDVYSDDFEDYVDECMAAQNSKINDIVEHMTKITILTNDTIVPVLQGQSSKVQDLEQKVETLATQIQAKEKEATASKNKRRILKKNMDVYKVNMSDMGDKIADMSRSKTPAEIKRIIDGFPQTDPTTIRMRQMYDILSNMKSLID